MAKKNIIKFSNEDIYRVLDIIRREFEYDFRHVDNLYNALNRERSKSEFINNRLSEEMQNNAELVGQLQQVDSDLQNLSDDMAVEHNANIRLANQLWSTQTELARVRMERDAFERAYHGIRELHGQRRIPRRLRPFVSPNVNTRSVRRRLTYEEITDSDSDSDADSDATVLFDS